MKKTKTPQTPQLQEPDTQSKRRLSLPKVAYSAFLCVMMSMIFCQPAYAATDVWTKAKEIMQDVYTQILAISTIAAIVTASVALLLMNFSRSGRTVDESRAWLKRICITWAILNGLGFICGPHLVQKIHAGTVRQVEITADHQRHFLLDGGLRFIQSGSRFHWIAPAL